MTDSQLHSLMASSPEKGQRALFEEYCGYVYSIAANKLRSCGTSEDIEECVSDIFIAIFRSLKYDKGRFDGDLKGLIGTIARRTAIDAYRRLSLRNGRTVPLDSSGVMEIAEESSVEETAESSEIKSVVLDCVKRLGKPDSVIIISHYFYGRTSGQIAAALSMTESAVQKRLQRARKKLRTLLEDAGINAEW